MQQIIFWVFFLIYISIHLQNSGHISLKIKEMAKGIQCDCGNSATQNVAPFLRPLFATFWPEADDGNHSRKSMILITNLILPIQKTSIYSFSFFTVYFPNFIAFLF